MKPHRGGSPLVQKIPPIHSSDNFSYDPLQDHVPLTVQRCGRGAQGQLDSWVSCQQARLKEELRHLEAICSDMDLLAVRKL